MQEYPYEGLVGLGIFLSVVLVFGVLALIVSKLSK